MRCASAGAERREGGLCAGPADVVIPQAGGKKGTRDAAAERRDAQDEFHRAAQARVWADGDFDADHGFAFDGVVLVPCEAM